MLGAGAKPRWEAHEPSITLVRAKKGEKKPHAGSLTGQQGIDQEEHGELRRMNFYWTFPYQKCIETR